MQSYLARSITLELVRQSSLGKRSYDSGGAQNSNFLKCRRPTPVWAQGHAPTTIYNRTDSFDLNVIKTFPFICTLPQVQRRSLIFGTNAVKSSALARVH